MTEHCFYYEDSSFENKSRQLKPYNPFYLYVVAPNIGSLWCPCRTWPHKITLLIKFCGYINFILYFDLIKLYKYFSKFQNNCLEGRILRETINKHSV